MDGGQLGPPLRAERPRRQGGGIHAGARSRVCHEVGARPQRHPARHGPGGRAAVPGRADPAHAKARKRGGDTLAAGARMPPHAIRRVLNRALREALRASGKKQIFVE
eukprot:14668253-Heterocapsa_arctica.AAC.1